jgi:hypothetical protein
MLTRLEKNLRQHPILLCRQSPWLSTARQKDQHAHARLSAITYAIIDNATRMEKKYDVARRRQVC